MLAVTLLVVPTLFPWYLVWVLPFLALLGRRPSWAFVLLTGLAALLYTYYVSMRAYWWTPLAEYVPFYALLLWEWTPVASGAAARTAGTNGDDARPGTGKGGGADMMRVLSFNIRGGLGMDGRRSTERIAATVAAQSPDVICFQEVHQRLPWSGFVDQPRRLERLLSVPVIFQRNLVIGIGGYGVAVASRLPILDTRRHFLPSLGERRGALEVSVQTPTGTVGIWCTHWGLGAEERARQAVHMASLLAASPDPCISRREPQKSLRGLQRARRRARPAAPAVRDRPPGHRRGGRHTHLPR